MQLSFNHRAQHIIRILTVSLLALLAIGIAIVYFGHEHATLPVAAGIGPSPQLPPPNPGLLPTVNPAPAVGWPAGGHPIAAPGLQVSAIAQGLNHPRWLTVLPDGDILVAESNTPNFPGDSAGMRGFIAKLIMGHAGAGVPSANRITLLRQPPNCAAACAAQKFTFLTGLFSPFGMALVGNDLYVANTDALWRFAYQPGQTSITLPGVKVTDLPGGPIDHHWTKNVLASADGSKLYVSVGSNSNVGENGMAAEANRAAIWEIDAKTGTHRLFATGLRNPVGMGWEPTTGKLWASVNERDEIGSDLVPDYMASVQDGGFYGWPYSYYGQHSDSRIQPPRPDLVARALVPDYALGAHTASLGLAFAKPGLMGPAYAQGAFIGQHGSWNRRPRSGYKVIFVPFAGGKPSGAPTDVLTGFLNSKGQAQGRPVGVALDNQGALLVADDVGNTIWRVTHTTP